MHPVQSNACSRRCYRWKSRLGIRPSLAGFVKVNNPWYAIRGLASPVHAEMPESFAIFDRGSWNFAPMGRVFKDLS